MADGTADQATKSTIEARLQVPGVEGFDLVGARVSEGLSSRSYAEVEVASHEDLDWASALLAGCTLTIEEVHSATRAPLKSRAWTLKLGEARFTEHTDNSFRYVLRLHDPLWPLGLGMSTRKFRNLTAQQIVSQILSEANVPHEFRLVQTLPVRKYTAQYRESNLAFIERLMEFEGVYYQFEEDGTVLFADASQSAERLRDGAPYKLIEASQGMARGDVGLHELRRGAHVKTGRVTLGDYNWKKPTVKLREAAFGDRDSQYERYEFFAGYREPDQGKRLAKLRTEAHRAEASYLDGRGNETAFAPGRGFAIDGGAVGDIAGEYLVVRLEHGFTNGDFAKGRGATEESKYENRFRAIVLTTPFRPIPKTQRPHVAGSHTAMVRGPGGEEIHTDKYGRFRAQLHWDREAVGTDEDSRWIRLMQETSSSMVIARTGWEVMVGYIDGDPDRPIGLGRSINGQMAPSYGQPGNKNMMSIKTPSSPSTGGFNEIKMDDSGGSQHMSWRAEKDYDAEIKNDKTEKVGHDETHDITNDFKREIHGNQSVTIGANDTHKYDAQSELKVKGNRSVKVGGSESVDVGGGEQITSTKGESEKVGAVRLNVVGSFKIPDFKNLAKQALQGLNPLSGIEAMVKDPLKGLLGGADLGSLFKDVKSVDDALKLIQDPAKLGSIAQSYLQGAVGGQVSSLLSLNGFVSSPDKLEGAGGFLPSVDQLKNMFSAESLQAGLTSKLEGALNTATGGLLDTFFPKGQDDKREFKLGWDQVDKLIDMFTIGGVSKTAQSSIRVMVGGASIRASLGKMEWGSKVAWLETIGGLKYTKTPVGVDQDVEKHMQVTVLGKAKRNAKETINIRSDGASSIDVKMTATYKSKLIEIKGVDELTVEASSELVLDGGGTTMTMKPGSVVIKGPLLKVDANEAFLIGNLLQVSK